MKAHAHTQLAVLGPVVLSESALGDDGGAQGRVGAGKGEEERVSLAVDLAAFVRLRRLPENAPLVCENSAVALSELLEQPRRALDVREQEGDCATMKLRRKPPCAEGSRRVVLVSSISKEARLAATSSRTPDLAGASVWTTTETRP